MAEKPALDFRSKEEFRALCHYLAMRMHYLNRVAMGEQKFPWQVAEALAALGRVFDERYDDPDIRALFGDGWTPGSLTRDEAADYLLGLIRDAR
ncbi:MAG: hypothetical protein R3D85_13525 [Paracoccaceae bacterium]